MSPTAAAPPAAPQLPAHPPSSSRPAVTPRELLVPTSDECPAATAAHPEPSLQHQSARASWPSSASVRTQDRGRAPGTGSPIVVARPARWHRHRRSQHLQWEPAAGSPLYPPARGPQPGSTAPSCCQSLPHCPCQAETRPAPLLWGAGPTLPGGDTKVTCTSPPIPSLPIPVAARAVQGSVDASIPPASPAASQPVPRCPPHARLCQGPAGSPRATRHRLHHGRRQVGARLTWLVSPRGWALRRRWVHGPRAAGRGRQGAV